MSNFFFEIKASYFWGGGIFTLFGSFYVEFKETFLRSFLSCIFLESQTVFEKNIIFGSFDEIFREEPKFDGA